MTPWKMVFVPGAGPEQPLPPGQHSPAGPPREGLGSCCRGSCFTWLAGNLPATETVRPGAHSLPCPVSWWGRRRRWRRPRRGLADHAPELVQVERLEQVVAGALLLK